MTKSAVQGARSKEKASSDNHKNSLRMQITEKK